MSSLAPQSYTPRSFPHTQRSIYYARYRRFGCVLLKQNLVNVLTTLSPAPPLSPAERNIVRSYGTWTDFMIAYGLKPYNLDDVQEGKLILEGMVAHNEQ